MDFFFLPYQGLMQGPWAFITGVTQGSSSLFRHITSGTLISITNLASSISRNMDRLSFDKIHLERNEELRRCPPIGVTRGLSQGLTGFGISLLGDEIRVEPVNFETAFLCFILISFLNIQALLQESLISLFNRSRMLQIKACLRREQPRMSFQELVKASLES